MGKRHGTGHSAALSIGTGSGPRPRHALLVPSALLSHAAPVAAYADLTTGHWQPQAHFGDHGEAHGDHRHRRDRVDQGMPDVCRPADHAGTEAPGAGGRVGGQHHRHGARARTARRHRRGTRGSPRWRRRSNAMCSPGLDRSYEGTTRNNSSEVAELPDPGQSPGPACPSCSARGRGSCPESTTVGREPGAGQRRSEIQETRRQLVYPLKGARSPVVGAVPTGGCGLALLGMHRGSNPEELIMKWSTAGTGPGPCVAATAA